MQRTFGDTREVAAAEAYGQATPAGQPLSPAALQTIRGIEEALKFIEAGLNQIRRVLASLPNG